MRHSSTGLSVLHEFDERLRLMNIPVVGQPVDFHLIRLGTCTDFRINFGPVRTNFYQIVLPTRAQFGHKLNAFARTSTENTLMFGAQGFTASFVNTKPVEGYAVWFKPEFLRVGSPNGRFLQTFSFFRAGAFPFLPLHESKVTELIDLYERIDYEYQSDNPYRFDVIRSYLTILLFRAKHLYEQVPSAAPLAVPSRAVQVTQAFQDLVAERAIFDRAVASYASSLCITPKHLSESVKVATGKTAHQLIAEQLLLEAKTLLLQTELTVTAIAHELRFHDPAHFFKFFRGQTGQSPSQFRILP
ncbi:helix-turn-helix domain-containing protein [Spirosoma arcticum]